MERIPVSSSNVESVGWEEDTLEVSFLSGGIYHYYNVPKDVYDDMLIADSVGSFLHHNVKGSYSFVRIQ